jgi:Putative addiction module component
MNELKQLEADLLALPVDSRASLARALIESLDEMIDDDDEALWADEIRRRDEDLRSGKAVTRPAANVLHDARERLSLMTD